jgi:membrane protein
MAKLQAAKTRVTRFLQTEIWRLSKGDLTRFKRLLLKPFQVLLLTVQGYVRDNCALRASAMTFYSLLSVVPVVALAFGIAKGFGLEQRLEGQLYERLAGQEEVVAQILTFARSLLENTKGGLVAGIGVIFLFWTALKVLRHIEDALNEIWKVKSRTFVRQFTDYLTIMIISPLLMIVSSSLNVYITTQVTAITDTVTVLEVASPVIFHVLQWVPYALTWLLFIMVYLVMPNTRVRFGSALIAGIIAGTLFQVLQGSYLHIQVLLSRYNAIYGSFAALPFFLIWLQLSWMILLLGAQIAYAHQHVGQYAQAVDYQDASPHMQKQYALYLLRFMIGAFEKGDPPPTAEQIADRLHLPHGLVVQLTERLIQAGMVSAVQHPTMEALGYQPARDIHAITVADVLESWDRVGQDDLPERHDQGVASVAHALAAIGREIKKATANRLVKDL